MPSWEVFTDAMRASASHPNGCRPGPPTLTFSHRGIYVSAAAAALLGSSSSGLVLLLWDEAARTVGLRAAVRSSDDSCGYKIDPITRQIRCSAFTRYIGVAASFTVGCVLSLGTLCATLPDGCNGEGER